MSLIVTKPTNTPVVTSMNFNKNILILEDNLKVLDDIYKKRQEIFDTLHMLISSIIVYSRPVTKKDKIAGRKKANQLIPYKLEMELKLPQDILNNFASRFGVKTSDLCARMDSNHRPPSYQDGALTN